jgi:hypothetical protein
MSSIKTINQNRASNVSHHECRAWRALKCDGYTHSEIAFMFETREGTVGRHVRHECDHDTKTVLEKAAQCNKDWTDKELLTSYREVYQKQPYTKMSLPVYREYRSDEHPAGNTIKRRFGGWPNARKRVWGEDDG